MEDIFSMNYPYLFIPWDILLISSWHPLGILLLFFIHEYSWTFMNIHENSWTFMNIHEHSWTFMNIPEHSWIFLNIPEHSWTFLNIHEHSWTFISIHEHSWAFMNIHEHSWTFITKMLTFTNMLTIKKKSSILIYRKCDNCGRKFATSLGLQNHLDRIQNKDCGRLDRRTKMILNNYRLSQKRREIRSERLDDVGPFMDEDVKLHKTKCRCVLKTHDKERVLCIFDIHKKHLNRSEVWYSDTFQYTHLHLVMLLKQGFSVVKICWTVFSFIKIGPFMQNHLHSLNIIYIHSTSFTFMHNHLHSFTILCIHQQSFAFMHNHLHSFAIVYVHAQSFTFIHYHLHSFTFIHNHLHSSTIIYIHAQSFTFIRNRLRSCTIIYRAAPLWPLPSFLFNNNTISAGRKIMKLMLVSCMMMTTL